MSPARRLQLAAKLGRRPEHLGYCTLCGARVSALRRYCHAHSWARERRG